MKLLQGDLVSVDFETTGLNPRHGDRPFSVSLCDKKEKPVHFRWEVDPFTRKPKIPKRDIEWINSVTADKSVRKVCHNKSFEDDMGVEIGVEFKGRVEDTVFMIQVLRSNEPHYLKYLGERFLGIPKDDQTELKKEVIKARRYARKNGWWIKYEKDVETDYWMGSPQKVQVYNNMDVIRAIELCQLWDPLIDKEGVRETYEREMRLYPVIKRMERRGMRVHPDVIDEETLRYKRLGKVYYQTIQRWFPNININSHPQMAKAVYDTLKMPVKFWTKGGKKEKPKPAVSGDALRYMDHEFPKAVLEYRASLKAISNFFRVYKQYMVKHGKQYILHAHYKQCGADTGRFSVERPALQTVASETSGRSASSVIKVNARRPFGPRKGYVWLLGDYKGEEVWVGADHAGCQADIKALLAGDDVHASVTRVAFKVRTKDDLTDTKLRVVSTKEWEFYRKRSKMVRFGLGYGAGEDQLAMLINSTKEEASTIKSAFFRVNPEYEKFMRRMTNIAQRQGFIVTPFGRKIMCGGYEATNYDIQGTCGDVMKEAMILCDKYFRMNKIDAHIVLTLHDELIFEIHESIFTPELVREIEKRMQIPCGRAIKLNALIPVDFKYTTTFWTEKKKYEFQEI